MRAGIVIIYVLVAGATACQGGSAKFTSEQDACSFAELSGWTAGRDRDSLLLREDADTRATIAVRAVPVDNDWVEARTPERVAPAVRKVLGALPGAARVFGPTPVRSSLDGVSFDVTFTPRGKDERYRRRHVVFFGEDSGRIFHVVLTVPEESAPAVAEAFEKVIDSFQEEV